MTGGQIIVGRWHHLVATVKKDNPVLLYQDAQLVGTSAGLHSGFAGGGSAPLYIGRRGDAQFLNGCVDEAALYNAVLTGAQLF